MSDAPAVLKPEYYFDMDLLGHSTLFNNVSFVWEAVKNMQDKTIVDRMTRERCSSEHAFGRGRDGLIGSVFDLVRNKE